MRHHLLYLCAFIFFCPEIQAQSDKDVAVWFNVYAYKKLNKKYTIHLNQQNRWTENGSRYNQGYADFGVTRKLNKHFKYMLDYVYIWRRNSDMTFSARHQYYAAIIAGQQMRRFHISYRLMFQGQNNLSYFSKENVPVLYIRNKSTLKYECNKYVTVYIAEEFFSPLNNHKSRGLDRSRSFVGMFYSMGRRYALEVYLAYQYQMNPVVTRKQDFILGLGYSIRL